MKHISNAFLVVDSSGAYARVAGDFDGAGYNQPRMIDLSPTLPADGIIKLTGNVFTCEYDSTGEIYIKFLDQFNQPITDTILFVRGDTIEIDAYGLQVVGQRRSGIVKISAATEATGPRIANSPSGQGDTVQLIWPAGVNGSNGPAGWTTVANPFNAANGYISYNPAKTLTLAGVLQGGAQRWESANPTVGNYNELYFGFVDVQGGVVAKMWPYYSRVVDTAGVGGTNAVDAQAHWAPAIFWGLTAAGVVANTGTNNIKLFTTMTGIYKRNPNSSVVDFT